MLRSLQAARRVLPRPTPSLTTKIRSFSSRSTSVNAPQSSTTHQEKLHSSYSSTATATATATAANSSRLPRFALAAATIGLIAGTSSFHSASCAPGDTDGNKSSASRAEMLKELASSAEKIERFMAAEKAVKALETKAGLPPAPKFPVALCQIHVGANKAANLINARQAVEDAAKQGARIISLPECFNSPYDTSCFPKYAEVIPETSSQLDTTLSPSTAMLVDVAKSCGVYLVGGSIPERGADGNVYNTCIIVSPDGEIIGKHRKMHLFDISIPGGITFKESDTLNAGNTFTTFDTEYGRIGVGICYDLRFPEQSMLMREEGCKMLIFPGAFNMTTGPAHWELLLRARALDNQVYVAAVSPARDTEAGYHAWGHSTVVSPWGDIVATTSHEPATVHADIDFAKVDEIRTNIPVSKQKRNDLYELNKNSKL